MEKLLRV